MTGLAPLIQRPRGVWRDIVGVFTDIDDTLTCDGAIAPVALESLGSLKQAGLHVIPITGRPVGWSEPFAQSWPVDAIVAENGSVALLKDGKRYQADAAMRAANFARLQEVAACVLREVPGTMLAQDSSGRETDIAIDHSEFAHLNAAQIAQVVEIMRREGLNASVSSIHVNGWIGGHDKWLGARWITQVLFGRDLASETRRWVYVGDSTNDQVMFQHMRHSVGVANIRRFEAELVHKPDYVTQRERGAGFAEVAQAILMDRTA
ncbi:HAD family hydrolase [Ottowia caeni]|uniref:HAD family hydrolase n=1 Tax=Ottowia caeni TaxID=2870339 RepID=UPI001E2DF5AB|nr:HAD-IIB family hydrolase [Ottowia caeni]